MRPSSIAYFSMEVGLQAEMPTYSGGLGVLAGDTLRAAADLRLPLVAVTLLHRRGYFRQVLDDQGRQSEQAITWDPSRFMKPEDARATIRMDGRPVRVRAWRYEVAGVSGGVLPLYFLDTDLPENAAADRRLTDRLYQGDERHRLRQETLLGLGGIAMLSELGHAPCDCYHMNEGHSSLLTLALLEAELARQMEVDGADPERALSAAMEHVRRHCVFTTHTPVPAGHDRFPMEMVEEVLEEKPLGLLRGVIGEDAEQLNMTHLGLALSRYVNGVAMRHGQVSASMFPDHPIDSITNGVHAVTWTAPAVRELLDRHIPDWRYDNAYLRYAVSIPLEEIRAAHGRAKQALIDEIARRTDVQLDPHALTIGFARRATAYKRADLLFSDLDRLRAIVQDVGPIQIVYGGKAHPHDETGKALIRRIVEASHQLEGSLKVVYLEEYDMTLGALITSGVDVWLNTPRKPQEASGTSGMKAALNGVPSFSVLDGWWVEGHVENVTGWSIGGDWMEGTDDATETVSLYDKLRHVIAPLFYDDPDGWARVMRYSIALNGSFFNAQRMMVQYVENAYTVAGAKLEPTPQLVGSGAAF